MLLPPSADTLPSPEDRSTPGGRVWRLRSHLPLHRRGVGASGLAVAMLAVAALGPIAPQPVSADPTPGCSPRALVANSGSDTVSVIDTTTDTISATIEIDDGAAPAAAPTGVAITPDGTTAYVPNNFNDTLSVVDIDTATVTSTIAVGTMPYGVAIAGCPTLGATIDGRLLTVTGTTFPAGSTITLDLAGTDLDTTTAAGNGTFTLTAELPCTLPTGPQILTATSDTDATATTTIDLTPCPPGPTPDNGGGQGDAVVPRFAG